MKNTGKTVRQLVAMLIALVCLIGPTTSITCSPLAGNDIHTAYQTSRLSAPFPVIEGMASSLDPVSQARGNRLLAGRPVAFEANHGQTDVSVSGKRLLVYGKNFSDGATIMLDDAEQPTVNDSQSPSTALLSKKAGKKVKPERSVTVRVKNADGTMSQSFQYWRPAN